MITVQSAIIINHLQITHKNKWRTLKKEEGQLVGRAIVNSQWFFIACIVIISYWLSSFWARRGSLPFVGLYYCRALTCLLKNLHAGEEATVKTEHGTTDWFQIGNGVRQGCILSPCLFNLYAEYIMRNAGLWSTSWNQDCRKNINDFRYADDTILWQKVKKN